MGNKTGIEWTDATWNPTIGCSRVSTGCTRCYAEQQAARIVRMSNGKPTDYDDLVTTKLRVISDDEQRVEARWTGRVKLMPDRLAAPLRWRKGRRVFVDSMSDLFHESLSNEQIAAVFGVMAAAPQHTFQVLTKRAKRMREWFEWVDAQPNTAGPAWHPAASSARRTSTAYSISRSRAVRDEVPRRSRSQRGRRPRRVGMAVRAVLGVGREDAGAYARLTMSRHNSAGSYGHRIARVRSDEFRVSWTVDRYYPGSRLRYPRRHSRDTDRKGAERFAKRWKIAMPAEPAPTS